MEIARRQLGENTRAVHLPPPPETAQRPLGTPVYRTAAFAFSSAQEYAAVLGDQVPGYSYSRIDNPTVDAFARRSRRWRAPTCRAGPPPRRSRRGWRRSRGCSGRSPGPGPTWWRRPLSTAARTACCETCSPGSASRPISSTSPTSTRSARRSGPPPGYLRRDDRQPDHGGGRIRQLGEIAHENGALLVIDSTLAPPVICRPLEHGADLVVHSATKYIGGHSDTTGGVVTGSLDLISQIRATRIDTGGSLSPDDAFLLRRGLETLPVRVRRQCATASVFAATCRHPAVAYVDYPGLPTHPGHELARRTFEPGRRASGSARSSPLPVRRPGGGARVRVEAAAGGRGDLARRDAHGRVARRVHDPPAARRPGAGGGPGSTRARCGSRSGLRTWRT